MTDAEPIDHLRRENAALREQLAQAQQQLAAALMRIAELEPQRPESPSFVKPNRPAPTEPKRQRKKRAAKHNLAERSIRPLVVIRKISGGSRSEEGSKTRMGLASLFETWQARKLTPFDECLKLLSQMSPFRAATA